MEGAGESSMPVRDGVVQSLRASCSRGGGLRFPQRFWQLVRLLRPYPALLLSLLSILESLVVAEGGCRGSCA